MFRSFGILIRALLYDTKHRACNLKLIISPQTIFEVIFKYRINSLKIKTKSSILMKSSRRIFGKWDGGVWTGLGWLRIGTGGGRL
jgi:hypothetical protein